MTTLQVKNKWTDADFKEMGWHDASLYSMKFPWDNLELSLDIDYIFKWERSKESSYQFWVSKCNLIFNNVLNLKIDIDFNNSICLSILEITRDNKRATPNGKMILWDYTIETDKGIITFQSTGYVQDVLTNPILSDSQNLQDRK